MFSLPKLMSAIAAIFLVMRTTRSSHIRIVPYLDCSVLCKLLHLLADLPMSARLVIKDTVACCSTSYVSLNRIHHLTVPVCQYNGMQLVLLLYTSADTRQGRCTPAAHVSILHRWVLGVFFMIFFGFFLWVFWVGRACQHWPWVQLSMTHRCMNGSSHDAQWQWQPTDLPLVG